MTPRSDIRTEILDERRRKLAGAHPTANVAARLAAARAR